MQLSRNMLLAFVTACTFVSASAAMATETPASLNGAEIVDAAKAKSLMDSGAKMIDTRVTAEYAEAHIKGAVSVTYKEKSAKAAD